MTGMSQPLAFGLLDHGNDCDRQDSGSSRLRKKLITECFWFANCCDSDHGQDTGSPHEKRRITATNRVAACNAGLTGFGLVCI